MVGLTFRTLYGRFYWRIPNLPKNLILWRARTIPTGLP